MSFQGNFLCCTTCYSYTGEIVGGTINLWGVFLLEGLFMPFFLREICHSFGETFFSFENFLFFASCFESSNDWYGYLPLFFHYLVAGTIPFATKSFL